MGPKLNNNSSLFSLYFVTMMIILLSRSVKARSPAPTSNSTSEYGYFSPNNLTSSMLTMVILIIALFFLVGFVSVYLRQCAGEQILGVGPDIQTPATNRQPKGLNPAIIAKFPIMMYSEVKQHKIGKRALECAVCLSEFEDDEKLRLLPKCSHVFHPDCIDAWLSGHATCPVCRCNLTDSKIGDINIHTPMSPNPDATTGYGDGMLATTIVTDQQAADTSLRPVPLPADAVVLEVQPETREKPLRLFASHSTGHSLSSLSQTVEDPGRFTLKLPDHVLRRIIAEGKLRRCSSSSALAVKESGEGSSRGGRRIRMFVREMLSERFSAWGIGWRADAEGSSVKGEGSVRGRLRWELEI